MSTNPYAPPSAPVADIATFDQGVEPPFFAVSVTKLIVMCLCTLGLYQIYWHYRNWRCIKERDRSKIQPALRSLFSIFFCYPCFARIRKDTSEAGGEKIPAGLLAIGWIVVSLSSQLPDPFWLSSLLAFLFLIPVQQAVNRFNVQVMPAHDPNASFSVWNWVWIIVGGLLLFAALVGTFLPPEGG
jgi:hypothetical protein